MSSIFRALFVILMFTTIFTFTIGLTENTRNTNSIKHAVEVAGHDALLQVDERKYEQGKIVFYKEESHSVYQESLERNLGIKGSSNYRPTSYTPNTEEVENDNGTVSTKLKSLLRGNLKIDRLLFIDEDTKMSDVNGVGKFVDINNRALKDMDGNIITGDDKVTFPLVYVDNEYDVSSGYSTYMDETGRRVGKKIEHGLLVERPGVVSIVSTKTKSINPLTNAHIRQATVYNYIPSIPNQ